MTSLPIADRQCGPCSVCCAILAIPELNCGAGKGNDRLCEHQDYPPSTPLTMSAGACKIYPTRPATCRSFACRWLADAELIPGDERSRPDNLGLMFAVTTINETGKNVLTAWEVWDGAAVEQKYLLDKLAARMKILVVTAAPERKAVFWKERTLVRFPMLADGFSAVASKEDGDGEPADRDSP